MLKQLHESQAERVRNSHLEHPLYVACQCAFTPLLSKMDSPLISVDEVFCGVAFLLDELLTEPVFNQQLTDQRWSEILVDVRRRSNDVSGRDAEMVAATVFSVVSAAIGLHWHSYYSYTLRSMLQSTLERETKSIDADDERMLHIRLAQCAEELSSWINEYADDDESLLSDEVDDCINGKTAAQKKSGSGRRKLTVATIRATFTYHPKGMDEREINIRLGLVFRELKNNQYIHADTDQQTFLTLFQGKPLDTKIIWTANNNDLCYFFRQLFGEPKYIEVPVGPGPWQVVAAHFLNKKEQTLDPDKLRTTTQKPKDTKILDGIIALFNTNLFDLDSLQDLLRRNNSDATNAATEHYKSSGMSIKSKR